MRATYRALGVCLWASPVAAEQGRISARVIEATPERAVAEGDVALRWSGHRFLAERLILEQGRDNTLHFEASDFVWTPCACATSPWAISGRTAEGVLDDHVVIRGGAFRVCDVPVLPVPFVRVPLDERAPRLLLPEVRVGEEGTVLGQPVWLPVGQRGHVTLTSEWWSRRWLRQRAHVEAPLGEASVAVAKDAPVAPTRGQMDVRGSHDDGSVRIGVDAGWTSDLDVRSDYGVDFIARSTPFEERLLYVGAGPARIETNTFDRGELQRPIAAVVSFSGLAIGPSSFSTYGRIDALEDAEHLHQQATAGAMWSLGFTGDWTDVEAEGLVEAVQTDDEQLYTRAGMGGALRLPMWRDLGSHRVLSQTGVEGWIDAEQGEIFDSFGLTRRRPRWAIGPGQRSQWISPSGVPLRWSAAMLRTNTGWRPQGTLNIDHGPLLGTVHGDPEVQAGMLGVRDEALDADFGVLRDSAVLQGVLRSAVRVARYWRPGWGGMYDFDAQRMVRHGPSLAWDPGCGCITANLKVEWAKDVAAPSVMLRLDLHARRPADR